MVRKFVLCAILALATSFAPVAPPKPTSTVVRSEPPKTSTPPINRATALSGGLLGGYLLLELGYVRSVWKSTSVSGARAPPRSRADARERRLVDGVDINAMICTGRVQLDQVSLRHMTT